MFSSPSPAQRLLAGLARIRVSRPAHLLLLVALLSLPVALLASRLGLKIDFAVDDGVRDAQNFADDGELVYASYDDVKKLHDDVLE